MERGSDAHVFRDPPAAVVRSDSAAIRAHRRIASTDRSASASVVLQFETEIRIAAMPCHVVPPSQHVPSAWTAAMTARVKASVAAASPAAGRLEPDQDLVEDDVVEDRDALRAAQPIGHPAGERAAPLDQVGEARPTERPQRGVDREPARTARRFRHPVVRVALAALRLDVVRRAERHRRVVRGRVADDDDPRVVRHVQPLVGVGRPGIGPVEARDAVAQPGRRGCPQPEGAVDVEPGVRSLAHGVDDLRQRIEGAGVHVAGLGADDRRAVEASQRLAQRVRAHPALLVGRDAVDPLPPEAEHLERDEDRDVGLVADDDRDRRRADEPVLLDGSSRPLEDAMPGGSDRREVRHRRAGR